VKISHYAIKHPAVITILLIALILGSLVSVSGIKRQLFAKIDLPQAFIFTSWPGGSPEEVEREITNPLEDELSLIGSVSSITSSSSNSLSLITISFTMETIVEDKLVEIREKINNAASQLPDDISGPPMVMKMSSSSLSAYTAAVSSSLPLITLSSYLNNQALPRFSRIPGVGQVSLSGDIQEEVFIELDLDRLGAFNLTPLEILQIFQGGNSSLPAGSVSLEKKTLNIRTWGRFDSLREMEQFVVGYRNNAQIRLGDVARVKVIPMERTALPLSRGEDILMLNFDLIQDADTTEVIDSIKKVMDLIESEQGDLISFFTLNDDSRTIELSLSSVINSAVAGGILAILILFLFLHNFRTTTIISLSIPLSLMLALAAMKLSGMTLNIMTLGGLTIAIGMIVDSSIVILENIYRHYRETEDRAQAALVGAEEMGSAVTASTMTSLAVFLPLLFLKGMVGEILRDISLTMGYSLLASLLAALVVVPYLSAKWLKPHPKKGETLPRLEIIFSFMERFMNWLSDRYAILLRSALRHRLYVIGLSLFLLLCSLLLTRFLGFEFVPSTDMNEIVLSCEFPPSYSLDQTREKTAQVEKEIYDLVPEAESSAFTVGSGAMLAGGKATNLSNGSIQLIRTVDRKRGSRELINLLQDELPRRIPDLNVTVKNGGFDELLDFTTGGIGMVINLYGSDLDRLTQASEQVMKIMENDPNVKKANRSVRVNEQELVIDLDHKLMGNLAVMAREASLTSRLVFNGMDGGEWEREGENLPIRIGSVYESREVDRNILNRIFIKNLAGHMVPMAAFSTLKDQEALSSIQHKDSMTTIKVSGQLYESNLRDTRDRVVDILEKTSFPAGVEWELGGSSAEMSSSFNSMFLILGAAVFLVYMVMVIQFERFAQPLIVMAAVPFTLIGVVLGLLMFGSTLNVVSLLGMIALSGIVVNNAIVLIDYTNLLRSRGKNLIEAVVEGGKSRLRPIIMTTLTTILGLLPIALGLGEGGKLLSSLGQAIAGGLITSTLITLVLIPVLYSLLEERILKQKEKEGVSP
jgi:HAE1 family hydrophobic/amphiphilic exporter-1